MRDDHEDRDHHRKAEMTGEDLRRLFVRDNLESYNLNCVIFKSDYFLEKKGIIAEYSHWNQKLRIIKV